MWSAKFAEWLRENKIDSILEGKEEAVVASFAWKFEISI